NMIFPSLGPTRLVGANFLNPPEVTFIVSFDTSICFGVLSFELYMNLGTKEPRSRGFLFSFRPAVLRLVPASDPPPAARFNRLRTPASASARSRRTHSTRWEVVIGAAPRLSPLKRAVLDWRRCRWTSRKTTGLH